MENRKLVGVYKCPNCGQEERAFERLRAPDNLNNFKALAVELFNKTHIKLGDEVEIMECLYDICLKCGVEYCYRISTIKTEVVERKAPSPNLVLPGPGQIAPHIPGVGGRRAN